MTEHREHLAELADLEAELTVKVVGEADAKELLTVALLAAGHILIEGPPGTGKTLLCKTFAEAIGGDFRRVQCTPDMLPGDVTGFYLYTPDGQNRFVSGPAFANVLMIDEFNRATPRTQASLLEAMQEHQVTLEGVSHDLPTPFLVIAAQVPYQHEAVYTLHESQMDRFKFRILSEYPSAPDESEILGKIDDIESEPVRQVLSPANVLALQEQAKSVFVSQEVRDYIIDVVHRLRSRGDVMSGPSPRGAISLFKAARARAFLAGRDYVIPDDVKRLAVNCLAHRLVVRVEAEADGVSADGLVASVLAEAPVPVLRTA